MRHGLRLFVILVVLVLPLASPAASPEQLYLLNCWGCHRAGAEGIKGSVPRIKGFGAYFLQLSQGRTYFASVPGVANSSLSNAEVAQVLNWMLTSFCKDQLPASFSPYQPKEIEQLRSKRMTDVIRVRRQLVDHLLAQGVISRGAMEEDRAFNTPALSSQSTNGSASR